MELFTTYLYFWGSLIACIFFAIFYILRKDLRRDMVKAGIAVGIIGIFSEYVFFQDYWKPPLMLKIGIFGGIEDFLFGLAAGGVGAVLYKIIFHKRLRHKNNPHCWIIPLVIISELLSIFLFYTLLKTNSIFASSIGFIIPVLVICIMRKDLIIESLYSAILGGSILILGETLLLFLAPSYLENYFLLYKKVTLLFGIAPITELIWGMALAALLGPLYEFDYGEILVNEPHFKKRNKKTT